MRTQDIYVGRLQRLVDKNATGFSRRRLAGQFVKPSRRLFGPIRHNESGATAVEFALTLPVLLMLLVGTVEVGRALFVDHTLTKAVRDGARFAIVRGAESGNEATVLQIEDEVRARAVGIDSAKINVVITYAPDNSPGSTITVQGNYGHVLMIPFIPTSQITLSAFSKMTIFQ